FKTPGTYTVVFSYIDSEAAGCSTQVVLPNVIVVHESPKADFSVSPGEITIADPEVTLTNQSSFITNNRYVWTIQGQGTSSDIHAKTTFTAPGNYKITLTATNLHQCKDEISKIVEVRNDFKVHIPNSFSPNFDGINDVFNPVFTPYGLDAKTFEMEIFDRWGHQVYRTKDSTKGWDGTTQGEVTKEDIYIYRIRYKDLDGKVYNTSGHLTLIR
ncbi:MAG: gliding motility-associated C-terminal domain-containing protein, partial [Chitinophagaceae bacterium]|nr:gliding motility-associated C-terminal domain-containing protein [Chitinophagaceae bacterium]